MGLKETNKQKNNRNDLRRNDNLLNPTKLDKMREKMSKYEVLL